MKNVLSKGINSNMLKTIAIIAMVIDHIGFYFSQQLPTVIYIVCRAVGRVAMPIFVYLLVQGFFHTKDLKKYVIRLLKVAVITQIAVTLIMVINKKYVPEYTVAKYVYTNGNILFSFVIALCTLKILHQKILVKKWEYSKNLVLKAVIIVGIIILCALLPIDYSAEVLVLSILGYYIEKLKIQTYMEKNKHDISIGRIMLNNISDTKINIIYLALVLLSLFISVIYFNLYWTVLLAIVPIALYNGERGKTNAKYIYYVIFPVHHIIIYLTALAIL